VRECVKAERRGRGKTCVVSQVPNDDIDKLKWEQMQMRFRVSRFLVRIALRHRHECPYLLFELFREEVMRIPRPFGITCWL